MSRTGKVLFSILVLLLAGLSASWFYNNFTRVSEQKEVGFQGLAKTNKLLAAEFFLRKMGVKVQQSNGLNAFRDLPASNYTLLIATQRKTINKELSENLRAWVVSGGHIIIEAKPLADKKPGKNNNTEEINTESEDKLLKDWSVFVAKSSADDDNKDIPVSVSLNYASRHSTALKHEIDVNFPYQKTLNSSSAPAPVWVVKDKIGTYLMQFSLGQGLITVVSSTAPFYNESIAEYDHAQFLHYLLQQPNHDAGVWLVRVDDMPSLWQWLWDNARYVMLSLSLLLLLWLWQAPFRFGPLLNDTTMARRSLLEHIRASGYYRWHHNQSGYLLEQVQNRLWLKVQASHPAVQREHQSQAYHLLSDITGIKTSLISDALVKIETIDEYEFTRKIRLLHVIYQRL